MWPARKRKKTMKKSALISVTDKQGVEKFARQLEKSGFQILSTGGTAKHLRDHGINLIEVNEYTKSPEMLDGRVKTLHPKIHGAILYDRNNSKHIEEIKKHDIGSIDVVVVNLYEFEKNAVTGKLSKESAIEHIDIGGPCMLRASAKNWKHVLSVSSPKDYDWLAKKIAEGSVTDEDRLNLAKKAFELTSRYDFMISTFLDDSSSEVLPIKKISNLRYGENPHQNASIYSVFPAKDGFSNIEIIQGKELSYNNYIDLDGACALVREFHSDSVLAIIKHTNPCGTAVGTSRDALDDLWVKALSGDPKSAFGGIVATNRPIDASTATKMSEIFLECIAAPSFTPEALEIFSKKKNLRLIKAGWLVNKPESADFLRSIQGALLIQDRDPEVSPVSTWKVVTEKTPSEQQMRDLSFAFKVASHVKSNTIVYAINGHTISVGAGQMSRIDAAEFAAEKAIKDGKSLKGAVLASDAFFPFRDCVDLAAKYGIAAIVQPGGSIKDAESIEAANEHNISMLMTGERHFRH